MTDKQVFELAYDYLANLLGDAERLESILNTGETNLPKTLNDIYHRLVSSAQNREMTPTMIGASMGGITRLGGVIFDFDPHRTLQYYGADDDRLLDDIIQQLNPKGEIHRSPRSKWVVFCKAVLSSAAFLAQFESADGFYSWCNFFDQDERARLALPLLISEEIDGLGFGLACDFIKELGYVNFGKPDAHITEIFHALKLSPDDKPTSIFRAIQQMSKAVGYSPFAVDKLFWLIGSDMLDVGASREAFIQLAQK